MSGPWISAFAAWLRAVFSFIAMALAAVGLYGVTAQSVLQRNREIGVRLALGAQCGDVLRMILRQSMVLIAGGLIAGVLAALALTSLTASRRCCWWSPWPPPMCPRGAPRASIRQPRSATNSG